MLTFAMISNNNNALLKNHLKHKHKNFITGICSEIITDKILSLSIYPLKYFPFNRNKDWAFFLTYPRQGRGRASRTIKSN